MKKRVAVLLIVFFLFVSAIVVLATVDFNRLGKDHVYVQIHDPVEVEEEVLNTGEILQRYWYESSAYAENGEAINVTFSATRELRQEAYLMLYVRNEDEVTSYDEVPWEEIPAAAQEQLSP